MEILIRFLGCKKIRVKELKGDSALNDDSSHPGDFSFYEQSGSKGDLMDGEEDFDDSSVEDQLLIDQEFPPEGLLSDGPGTGDAMDVDLKASELEELTGESPIADSGLKVSLKKQSQGTPKVTRTSTRLKQQKQAVLQKLNTAAHSSQRRGSRESLGGGGLGSAPLSSGGGPGTPGRGLDSSTGPESSSPFVGEDPPSTPLSQQSTPQRPLVSEGDSTGGAAFLERKKSKTVEREVRDELIRLHRQHLRDTTDMNKVESKLLVSLTMKMGKQILGGSEGSPAVNEALEKQIGESFGGYVSELRGLLVKKQEAISEMLDLIESLSSSSETL